MGLDMYLSKRNYVKNWDHYDPEKRTTVSVIKGGEPVAHIKPERIAYVIEEVGYWRKANQIHKWFVDHCGNGEKDSDVYVSAADLTELRDTCKKVLKASKLVKGKIKNGSTLEGGKWVDIMEDGKYIKDPKVAAELLPTESGFFFGSTDYDEYYIQDLKDTVKMLDELLSEPDANMHDYIYDSSY